VQASRLYRKYREIKKYSKGKSKPSNMQKIIFMSMLLLSITAAAQQTQSDSAATTRLQTDSSYKVLLDAYGGRITYKQMMDTTGQTKIMQDYGMRIYDPRIGRYIPPDPNQSAIANPYVYPKKLPVKRAKKKQ
jgi:RHS repeat-associated protein